MVSEYRKGPLELHFDSMLDPSEHFVGDEVLRSFSSGHTGLDFC
jgi:hypothetical protein